jgi:protein ImuB
VLAFAGPWPVDERWWDGAGRRRRVRLQVLAERVAYLLVLEHGDWSIEGAYD